MSWIPWFCLFLAVLGDAARPSPAAPVVPRGRARPNHWAEGDIFATSPGALHIIDGKKFQEKKTLMLRSRQNNTLCPGQIAGGAFNQEGSLLYLVCEEDAKVLVVAAAGTAAHKVLRNFTTPKRPSSIAVDRSGMLYIGNSNSTSGIVDWYSPQDHYIGQLNLAGPGEAVTGLKMAQTPNGTALVATTRASGQHKLHKFNMQHWKELYNATAVQTPKKCHGMDLLPDGSALIACEACVYHMAADAAAPAGPTWQYCPKSSRPVTLAAVALDPSGAFFYALDTTSATIHKVSLSTWRAKATVTLTRLKSAKGLMVLQKVDKALLSAKRKPVNETTGQDVLKQGNATKSHSHSDDFLAIG